MNQAAVYRNQHLLTSTFIRMIDELSMTEPPP